MDHDKLWELKKKKKKEVVRVGMKLQEILEIASFMSLCFIGDTKNSKGNQMQRKLKPR